LRSFARIQNSEGTPGNMPMWHPVASLRWHYPDQVEGVSHPAIAYLLPASK
jgi:hypothetical protein